MKIDKNYKGLKNVGWRYEYEGNIVTEEALEVDLDMGLYVSGHIEAGGYIEAGEYIEAGGSIRAGEFIKAGEFIETGWCIKAGGYIEAGRFIEAGGYIEAGGSIRAGEFIKAGEYIEAGRSIEAGWYIKAGRSIKAGEDSGISAGLYINCKGVLKFGLKCFAGVCTWREITDEEKTITCGKLEGGVVEYGILKETGIEYNKERKAEILKKIAELKAEADRL